MTLTGIWSQTICWLIARAASSLVTLDSPSKTWLWANSPTCCFMRLYNFTSSFKGILGPRIEQWLTWWSPAGTAVLNFSLVPRAMGWVIKHLSSSWYSINTLNSGWSRHLGSGMHPRRALAQSPILGWWLWSWSALKDFPGCSFSWILD